MNDDEYKLYIPENVQKRQEIAKGIGKKEAVMIAVYLIAGIMTGVILVLMKGTDFFPVIPIGGMGMAMTAYVFYQKDNTNRSTVDKYVHYKKFKNSQKDYKYKKIG